MYSVERNLIAARGMGASRFIATVPQQNRIFGIGDDTDMGASGTMEDAESERPLAADPPVEETVGVGDLTQVHDTLRSALNAFLAFLACERMQSLCSNASC